MADALISPAVGMTMNAVSAAAIGISVVKAKKDIEGTVPLMGVAGALVFAAQMINFSIPATGSSGHVGGGVLLSGLLGGPQAFLSLAVVVIIQCLFFADGGLLALGCNIFNIAAVPCLLVYPLVFKPLVRSAAGASARVKRLGIASVLSAVGSTVIGAFCITLMTLLSGITSLPFGTFAGLMLPIHAVIGLTEGLVTAAVLYFIWKAQPERFAAAKPERNSKSLILALALCTVIVGGALTLLASEKPDGLEWSIAKTSDEHPEPADSPESALPVPGLVGAGITFALAGGTGFVIAKTKRRRKADV